MTVQILNYLHRKGYYWLLCRIAQAGYLFRRFYFVRAEYHRLYRAYSYKVRGTTYLSAGPGWAYSFDYLKGILQDSFCYLYVPKRGDCVVDIGAGLGASRAVTGRIKAEDSQTNEGPNVKLFEML